jgi:hypothetical protein
MYSPRFSGRSPRRFKRLFFGWKNLYRKLNNNKMVTMYLSRQLFTVEPSSLPSLCFHNESVKDALPGTGLASTFWAPGTASLRPSDTPSETPRRFPTLFVDSPLRPPRPVQRDQLYPTVWPFVWNVGSGSTLQEEDVERHGVSNVPLARTNEAAHENAQRHWQLSCHGMHC